MKSVSRNIPTHIAVIMDGNGRWANARGLPRKAGHRAGAEAVREAMEICQDQGVQYLTLYAFSSENWNRPAAEITALMKLLQHFLRSKSKELQEKKVRLRAIGRLHMLPANVLRELEEAIEATSANDGLTMTLALSYGSREEIVDAARALAQKALDGEIKPEDIDRDSFSSHLYTAGQPDPDLLIRTSGELRLSNFLLWQLSYAEIFISEKNWPDFRKADFLEAIEAFMARNRRFGKV